MKDKYVSAEHILLALAQTTDSDLKRIIEKYQITENGEGVAILALGCFYKIGVEIYTALKKQGVNATLVNPRFINCLDKATLDMLKEKHHTAVTLEDGILCGGFGEKIASYYANDSMRVLAYGLKKEFIDRYNPCDILKENGIEVNSIIKDILG